MAGALVSMVLEQFASYAQQEVELVAGVRGEVGKLSLTLKMIQGVLQDAEQKQVKNGAVKVWLEELKNVLYDADDVMDEWNTKIIVSQLQRADRDDNASRRRKVLSHLRSPFSSIKHVIVRYHISHQIKKIREELDEIAARKNQFGLTISSSHIQARRVTSSVIDVSKVRGRDEDKEEIVSRLLGESSHQAMGVHVVAVVGMAGFGKTTLAKLVLEDDRVVKNYEKKMWVCVSEPFDLIGLAKAIIEEARGEVPMSTEWESVHQGLSKSVGGKRFLLVLDDVWTKDRNHWNQLKVSLDGGAPGSRVIVTTRNEEVAMMMGSSHTLNLKKLSDDDSWSMLGDIALEGREDERTKFESIGKEIANKCKGVPLALSTLAALLCEKTTVKNWRDILASDIWDLAHMEDFFLPSLFMSYYSLPSVSKQCFLYCAVFPKDTEMAKDVLVKLWMAEGFLGSGRTEELEKVGEDHFDNLAMRSFFQDFKKDYYGNITSCKMHDLVHDFAQYLSHNECSNDTKYDCEKVRYLYSEEIENPALYEAKKLRTLICHKRISVQLFNKFPSLRVLDLQFSDLEELPNEVENLVHLRYLNLSATRLLELPETVCNLYNLQTLRLNYCRKIHKLPEEIGRLANLRHLEMVETDALLCLPKSIKRLCSLRTLSKFIISSCVDQAGCKIGDLNFLKSIRGALELKGLYRMTDENDVIQAELNKKKDLYCLTLDCEIVGENELRENKDEEENDAAIMMKNLFERLEPHEDLEELNIRNYPGFQFPRWFQNNSLLRNMVKIELYKCKWCTGLPAFGKLASLECLAINGMGSVKSIGHQFYGFGMDNSFGAEMIAFPKLKILKLEDMKKWEDWELPISKYTKIMPLLCELRLKNCPKLKSLPCLGNLESLEILFIEGLSSFEQLGIEFLGLSNDDECDDQSVQEEEQVIFPNLRELSFFEMDKLEQWSVPFGKYGMNILPCLRHLRIMYCLRLRVLPDFRKFKSLVCLDLCGFGEWEGKKEEEVVTGDGLLLGEREGFVQKFLGGRTRVIHKNFSMFTGKNLFIQNFWGSTAPLSSPLDPSVVATKEKEGREEDISMPSSFSELTIEGCFGLKFVPRYLFSPTMKKLTISTCPELSELQSLPPFLESLQLIGDNCGYSKSIPVGDDCIISYVMLNRHPYSYLPEGFKKLKALRKLEFNYCDDLYFELKELADFPMLQELTVYQCPLMEIRFQGDEWRSILAHVPKITIEFEEITNQRQQIES